LYQFCNKGSFYRLELNHFASVGLYVRQLMEEKMVTRDDMNIQRRADKLQNTARDLESEIREDLDNIKTNVVGLAQNLKEAGAEKVHVATDYIRNRADDIRNASVSTIEKAEDSIKSNPAQSVVLAFACGVLTSFLIGRTTRS
jgi:ElaB/YqjD/DUF883 family membrane-anchored ribosome-binding protein